MRLISGTIKSTPIEWLHVLSHILPPEHRRQNALLREYKKIMTHEELRVHVGCDEPVINRLRSRHPPLKKAAQLMANNYNSTNQWRQEWTNTNPLESNQIPCTTDTSATLELECKTWATLNRIRTKHGRCADFLYRWKKVQSPQCDCDAERQTIGHIIQDCLESV